MTDGIGVGGCDADARVGLRRHFGGRGAFEEFLFDGAVGVACEEPRRRVDARGDDASWSGKFGDRATFVGGAS